MKRLILGIFVSLIALSASAVTAGDFVLLKSGKYLEPAPKSGEIPPLREDYESEDALHTVTSEDYDKVMVSLRVPGGRSSRTPLDTDKVDKIFYWPKPPAWTEGAKLMGEGHYAEAIAKFESLAKNGSNRFWVRAYSIVNMALIYEAAGDLPSAIAAWERLTKEFPKFRQVPHALIQIGLGWLQQNDTDKARAAFGRLQRLPGLPEGKKGLAKYYLIYIEQKQGENSKNDGLIRSALSKYESLLGQVEGDSEQKEVAVLARLGIGNCRLALGQYDEAVDYFQKIADSTNEKDVLAGAFNGLGNCYFAQGKYKDALLAFLRVEVNYDVIPEQTAEALFKSGKCFHFMNGKGIGEDSANRARMQYRKCFSRFPGTTWAEQAQQLITTVKNRGK